MERQIERNWRKDKKERKKNENNGGRIARVPGNFKQQAI